MQKSKKAIEIDKFGLEYRGSAQKPNNNFSLEEEKKDEEEESSFQIDILDKENPIKPQQHISQNKKVIHPE